MNMYADVLVEIKAKQVDKTFTYKIPTSMQTKIQVGVLVVVPLATRKVEGYVLKIHEETPEFEAKEIISVKNDEPVLTEELINLGYFLKSETLCSLSSCISTMLPKALKAKEGVTINKKYISYLIKNNGFELTDEFNPDVDRGNITLVINPVNVNSDKIVMDISWTYNTYTLVLYKTKKLTHNKF